MASERVTAAFSNGVSTIEIPAGFVSTEIWLLVNGQVWTDSNFTVSGNALTVSGVDLSNESMEISSIGSLPTTVVDSGTLETISRKLDALLTSSASTPANADNSPTITTASARVVGLVNSVSIESFAADRLPRFGMNAATGRLLTGVEHLKQSIADIILTVITTRVMRRSYGSDVFLHKDKNMTPQRIVQLYAAVASAIEDHEPRIVLDRVYLDTIEHESGEIVIVLDWRIATAYQSAFVADAGSSAANDRSFSQRLKVSA